MSPHARRSVLAVAGLALVASAAVPLGQAAAEPAAPASVASGASAGVVSAPSAPAADAVASLKRIKRGLKVKVVKPSAFAGKVKIVVKGPKGWKKKTISKTKKWKKARPGTYRITVKKAYVTGLVAPAKVKPASKKVKIKKKTAKGKRGAQLRVTYSNPAPRCATTGPAAFGAGNNTNFQIGDGTTTDRTTAVQVGSTSGHLRGVTAIGATTSSGHAVCADGSLWGWGQDVYGQIGDGAGDTTGAWPVRIPGLTGVVSLAGGEQHMLALRNDGTVWSWGHNGYGQLGIGTVATAWVPTQVAGLSNVRAIAAGSYNGYALLADGTVRAWGLDVHGELGNGIAAVTWLSPVAVADLTGVTDIAAGGAGAYALLGDGTVRAWGSGYEGALGNGGVANATEPVTVSGLDDVVELGAGRAAGYAVLQDGTVRAWGSDARGALGDGGPVDGGFSTVPVTVSALTGVKSVFGSNDTAYALRTDGSVLAWGAGSFGQFANGAKSDSSVPVSTTLTGVTAVASRDTTLYVVR
jgi:alpha-tubulin suppressor-like RCC1 family protein